MPKASVIISVYNKPEFLRLVLAGLEIQTEKDFEVIVSDDGSNKEFVKGLNEIISKSLLNITHNWHEDAGFRKNKILNSSVVLAKASYLIFLDGDCIPHPEFVKEHLLNAAPDTCLAGRRVDLSKKLTETLTAEKIKNGSLQSANFTMKMLWEFLRAELFNFKYGIYLKNPLLRRLFNRKEKGLLGANFSLHKTTLLAINGFDERYHLPTFGEDSDVEFRLRLNGVKMRTVLHMAVAYHCRHNLLPRLEESKKLYEQVVKAGIAFTPYGIQKP